MRYGGVYMPEKIQCFTIIFRRVTDDNGNISMKLGFSQLPATINPVQYCNICLHRVLSFVFNRMTVGLLKSAVGFLTYLYTTMSLLVTEPITS